MHHGNQSPLEEYLITLGLVVKRQVRTQMAQHRYQVYTKVQPERLFFSLHNQPCQSIPCQSLRAGYITVYIAITPTLYLYSCIVDLNLGPESLYLQTIQPQVAGMHQNFIIIYIVLVLISRPTPRLSIHVPPLIFHQPSLLEQTQSCCQLLKCSERQAFSAFCI